MQAIKIFILALRATVISVEFLVIVIGIGVHYLVPSLESQVGVLLENDELLRYLCFAPICAGAWTFKCLNGVWSPDHKKRQVLTGWQNRHILKTYAVVALFYTSLSVCGGVYVFAQWNHVDRGVLGMVLGVSLGVSVVNMFSAYLAKHKLIELLDEIE